MPEPYNSRLTIGLSAIHYTVSEHLKIWFFYLPELRRAVKYEDKDSGKSLSLCEASFTHCIIWLFHRNLVTSTFHAVHVVTGCPEIFHRFLQLQAEARIKPECKLRRAHGDPLHAFNLAHFSDPEAR